jgi:ribosomal protein L11 methyltransferase
LREIDLTKMKKYKDYTITADPFIPEIISSILWQLDITGVNEEVNCIKAFADENSSVTSDAVSELMQKLVEQRLLRSFNVEENILEEKNWNEEWEKSINVIHVSDKIVIKPTFREYEAKGNEIVITIDPKMSFGTGEHQTTKLVLQLLEKYVQKDIKVLDIGSGTAVLSIASVKLGASSAVAVDNDEWCFENGKENCFLNNVEGQVLVKMGELKDVAENDFDLITANIQKNVLLNIAEEIKFHLKEKGRVILSGLLYIDEKDIMAKYASHGFKLIEKLQMDEWIALVLEK